MTMKTYLKTAPLLQILEDVAGAIILFVFIFFFFDVISIMKAIFL